MSSRASNLPFVFSCIGHTYIHLFTAFYFVIVLALETAWGLPYHELIALWTPGALLVGLGALPAGWLGDRWSASGMMVVFFIGMGGSAILCGVAGGPVLLAVGLGGIGLFASIYHPVGIAWLVRNTTVNRGKALGVNGIFGSLGVATAGAIGGLLIDLAGWRAAFIVPGAVSLLTGFALWACVHRGLIEGAVVETIRPPTASRRDLVRVFGVLLLTMFVGGIIFQSTQTALPKLFAGRLGDLAGDGALGVGLLVALVYGVAGVMQLIGGFLADRYSLRAIYMIAFAIQIPLLFFAAGMAGLPLLAVSTMMVVFSIGALPAENMLLANYAPEKHHGLAFGMKFVLAFGAAPLALLLVSAIHRASGGFELLLMVLAGFALLCFAATLLLPGTRGGAARTAAAAE